VFLSLNHWCTSPLRLQALDCGTLLSMCDVPKMAVFCIESVECLPGISSRYCLSTLVTVPVAPVTTGITEHGSTPLCWTLAAFSVS
jgi:hypothetical protein